jgi:site-specific recombinase XerD
MSPCGSCDAFYDEGMDHHRLHDSTTEAQKHAGTGRILPLILEMLPTFLDYLRVEENRSPGAIDRYHSHIQCFLTEVGDCPVSEITNERLSSFKRCLLDAGLSPATMAAMLSCFRTFLKYLREVHQLPVYDPTRICRPKIPTRKVAYLTKAEIQRFFQAIPTTTLSGLRDRALIEILYASGMRISEALSLNRNQINWELREAHIIGKGSKPRKVYFTDEALQWLREYLSSRHDDHQALFVIQSHEPKRLYHSIVCHHRSVRNVFSSCMASTKRPFPFRELIDCLCLVCPARYPWDFVQNSLRYSGSL